MEIHLLRTDSDNEQFQLLSGMLDADLSLKNGEKDEFFRQYNKIDKIKHAVVASIGDEPVGSGAIKEYDAESAEVKRMFVLPERRGHGIAGLVLQSLEQWAKELGYKYCILETGSYMPDAIALYKKHGYAITGNYGQYIGVDVSVCFKKEL